MKIPVRRPFGDRFQGWSPGRSGSNPQLRLAAVPFSAGVQLKADRTGGVRAVAGTYTMSCEVGDANTNGAWQALG